MTANIHGPGFPTIAELAAALRRQETTAVALAEQALATLETQGKALNAVVTTTADLALAQARRADTELAGGVDRGPLHGIPYGAKDLLAVRGYPTTWGAVPFRDRVIDADATLIRRLEEAGAVLVAKLAMVELAGGFGYDQPNAALTGPGRNPWHHERWAGGSSNGSGAAVAAGSVPLAIGSETWGSIHVPAAFCGVTGFRPTYGLVSRAGAMALSWSMDKIGPLAHTAEDCELALLAMAGHDPADPTTLPRPRFRPNERRSGFRFATIAGVADNADPDVAENYLRALEVFRQIGTITEVNLPEMPFDAAASTIISVEAASAFEDFLEAGHADMLTAPEDRVALFAALSIPATDYLRALRVRRQAIAAMGTLLAPFDAIIAPADARTSPPLTESFSKEPKNANARTIGGAANVCGLPGVALPSGLSHDGLPTSVSLTGKADADAVILAAGIAFQALTAWHRDQPRESDSIAQPARSAS